jgi:hypothetical protein
MIEQMNKDISQNNKILMEMLKIVVQISKTKRIVLREKS